jgi:asparagine synthase (glutamine-hydrolysing)
LSPARLRLHNLFNVNLVEQRVREHMTCRRNHGYWLWNVLMFQVWHGTWCGQ